MGYKDPDIARAYFRAHYLRNREKKLAYQAAYNVEHLDERTAYYRAHYQQTKDRQLAQQKQRYETNKDTILQRCKEYYEANKEQIQARNKAYAAANRPVLNAISARHAARKRGALISDLTRAQWETIKACYDYRCVYCGIKPKRLERDHITPLAHNGNHTYTNIVPACRRCNAKKRDGAVLCPVQPLLVL